ncbi:MAG: hypothetical protein AAGD09_18020 [Cyanobacteria bacterium P01_F01_bin.56]
MTHRQAPHGSDRACWCKGKAIAVGAFLVATFLLHGSLYPWRFLERRSRG